MKNVLMVIDVQNDFCPGGTLAVPGGDKIIPKINNLLSIGFDQVMFSQDWHPANTKHFEKWPEHCLAGTEGADLHDALRVDWTRDFRLKKGTAASDDGYSIFESRLAHIGSVRIEMQTWALGNIVDEILNSIMSYDNELINFYICGLATDYCVKASALDAANHRNARVFVISDAIKGVSEDTTNEAIEEMEAAGIQFVMSDNVILYK